MNFKNLTNEKLTDELKQTVAKEREVTVRVLWLLRECERRMLYAERGYPSLFAYCVSELSYSSSSAQRRIISMRLLRDLPEVKRLEIETKLSNGDLNLSHLSLVQTHARDQAKNPNLPKKTVSEQVQDKLDLLKKVANTSTRECEQILASLNSGKSSEKEKCKPVNAEESRVSFIVSNELMEKIERVQNARGHQLKEKSILEVLTLLVNEEIKRDEKKKTSPVKMKSVTSESSISQMSMSEKVEPLPAPATRKDFSVKAAEHASNRFSENSQKNCGKLPGAIKTQSRYIARSTYRKVYEDANHRCEFIDPETGKRCDSTYRLQLEHCLPFALGGSNELENLKLHCSTHNFLNAKRVFGFMMEIQTSF